MRNNNLLKILACVALAVAGIILLYKGTQLLPGAQKTLQVGPVLFWVVLAGLWIWLLLTAVRHYKQ